MNEQTASNKTIVIHKLRTMTRGQGAQKRYQDIKTKGMRTTQKAGAPQSTRTNKQITLNRSKNTCNKIKNSVST